MGTAAQPELSRSRPCSCRSWSPLRVAVRSWCREPDVSVPDVPWQGRKGDHRGSGSTGPWVGCSGVSVPGWECHTGGSDGRQIQNETSSPSLYSVRIQEGRRLPQPSPALWDTEQPVQTSPGPEEGAEAPIGPWDDGNGGGATMQPNPRESAFFRPTQLGAAPESWFLTWGVLWEPKGELGEGFGSQKGVQSNWGSCGFRGCKML